MDEIFDEIREVLKQPTWNPPVGKRNPKHRAPNPDDSDTGRERALVCCRDNDSRTAATGEFHDVGDELGVCGAEGFRGAETLGEGELVGSDVDADDAVAL